MTNAPGWTLTTYTAGDAPAVAELQQLLWHGGAAANARYLEWKYLRNPYVSDPYIVLAWANERLVGMIGAFGACWEIPGAAREVLPCLADTVIAPAHRGTRLFGMMLDRIVRWLAADGVPWLLDFGDQPAGPAMLMRGWTSIGPWAVATSGPRAAARSWREGSPASPNGRRSGALLRASRVVDPEAVAGLIARVEPVDRVRHVRDRTYLEWRVRNPLADYRQLTAGEADIQGCLIAHRARVDSADATPTTITDCEALTDEVWGDLIEEALACLPGGEIVIWARDLTPARLALLAGLGVTVQHPTQRLTANVGFPNLLVCRTGVPFRSSMLAELATPSVWDLRSICGRSWR